MRRIFQNRILELGRGEEGVALVVTLAVFMFMYIFCAGVFAVGKMVKDRISLQNAADAAAYSAAVVQADTLSRIATINRAMSWTYAQMNKRRMDFIVYRWMEHARNHYRRDESIASAWANNSCKSDHSHGEWKITSMTLNGHHTVEGDRRLGAYLSYFRGAHLSGQSGSLYDTKGASGIQALQNQIDADMAAINLMNQAEDELIYYMPGRIETAAAGILRANVPEFGQCGYVVHQNDNPLFGIVRYIERLVSNGENELRFLEWGNTDERGRRTRDLRFTDDDFENGYYDRIVRNYFDIGTDTWFRRRGDGNDGFRRSYEYNNEYLKAEWSWYTWHCEGCHQIGNGPNKGWWKGPVHHRFYGCGHNETRCTCGTTSDSRIDSFLSPDRKNPGVIPRWHRAECYADNATVRYAYHKYFEGSSWTGGYYDRSWRVRELRARPNVLNKNFFSGAGTITVGVARPNDNPWRSVLGKALSNIGLYHAFDPYLDWMVCFSSARAGYKLLHGPSEYEDSIQEYANDGRWPRGRIRINQQVRVEMGDRDYCIDWKELQPVIRKLVKVKNRHGRKIHGRDWHWQPEWVKPLWRQSWNLRQSDWDAVMIPVCRAASGAEERTDHARTYGDFREPCWGATDGNYLEDLVMNGKWIFPEDRASNVGAWYAFSAGPDKPLSISDYGYIDYEPGDLGGLLNKLPENYQGWQSNRGLRGGASVIKWPYRWRVSAPGSRLNWVELQKEMLH